MRLTALFEEIDMRDLLVCECHITFEVKAHYTVIISEQEKRRKLQKVPKHVSQKNLHWDKFTDPVEAMNSITHMMIEAHFWVVTGTVYCDGCHLMLHPILGFCTVLTGLPDSTQSKAFLMSLPVMGRLLFGLESSN